MICTIPKGSHYCSGYSLGSLHTGIHSMEFDVMFDMNCLQLPGQKDCDTDWNKLFGFSYGLHQSNSLRLVWRSAGGRIKIGWYNYESGKVSYKGFAAVNVEEFNHMKIDYNEAIGIVTYSVGQMSVITPYRKSVGWGYNLKPYYGGNCSAPITMKITLN